MFSHDMIANSSFVSVPDDLRLAALNRQLEYAAENSPFYAAHLQGLFPLDSLEKLEDLPFTTAEDIKTQGRRMICVPAGNIRRIVSLFSSGTTAEPKRVYFTQGDLQRTVDFFAEGMAWMCSPGDKVGILLPCTVPDGVGDLLARGLETLGAQPLRYGPVAQAQDLAARMALDRPQVLVGMPWQVRLLSMLPDAPPPKTVLLSADYVPRSVSSFLEARWGCTVLSHFGMTETCMGCAVESPLHDGMYLRRDELIAEITDPESGRALPAGETGELVLTTLRREAMPLIRYRTGDFARLVPGAPCRIQRVFGRINSSPGQYRLQELMCALPWLYDYQLSQTPDGTELTALLTDDAPPEARSKLKTLAEETLALTPDIVLRRAEAGAAAMFRLGKRAQI